jgi:hypothetical protein
MSDRIEREVEELLARLDTFPPKKPLSHRIGNAVRAPFRALGDRWGGLHLPSVSSGHVLLAAIVICVIAWVALSGSLQTYLLAGGILLFIGAFVMSLRRQSRPTQKYWRDRPMDLDDRRRRR